MANPQLHPLEVNPKTGEPFLRLPAHKNIILTPPRVSDGPSLVSIFNDERVYPWLTFPPHPYLPEHAESWLNRVIPETEKLLAELEDARNDPTLKIVDGCPARVIREVKEDGTDIFLGEIWFGLSRHWWELEGSGKASQGTPRRDPNDPDIWMVGDYLASSHHGQGIMSDTFNTLLRQWGIPRMGVQRMVVSTFEGNKGSCRVFEKMGFKFRKTIDNATEARGTMRGVHVLEWTLEDEAKVADK